MWAQVLSPLLDHLRIPLYELQPVRVPIPVSFRQHHHSSNYVASPFTISYFTNFTIRHTFTFSL